MTQALSLLDLLDAVQLEQRHVFSQIDETRMVTLADMLQRADRIFIDGKGRTGLHMRAFAMRLMQLRHRVHVVGDVTTPGIRESDLLIIGSGSGQTPSLVQHAHRALEIGVPIILFTAKRESPLSACSQITIVLQSSTKQDVASAQSILPLAALFEQSLGLLLDMISVRLMQDSGMTNADMMQQHANLE